MYELEFLRERNFLLEKEIVELRAKTASLARAALPVQVRLSAEALQYEVCCIVTNRMREYAQTDHVTARWLCDFIATEIAKKIGVPRGADESENSGAGGDKGR